MRTPLRYSEWEPLRIARMRQLRPFVVFLLIATCVLSFGSPVRKAEAHNRTVPAAPYYTRSYYVQTKSTSYFYQKGVSDIQDYQGRGLGNVILIFAFGRPMITGNQPGTRMYNGQFASTSEIHDAIMEYGRGLVNGTSNLYTTVNLVIGTSNDQLVSNTGALSHGVAWGQLMTRLDTDFYTRGWTSRLSIVGGSDIEIGFSAPGPARSWLDGYHAGTSRVYYDFGDAAGCYPAQPGLSDPTMCDNNWTRDQVWYKAFGSPLGIPIPQIYFTRNNIWPRIAGIWQKLSLYSYLTYNYNMRFRGTTTEHQACIDVGRPDECYHNYNHTNGEFTNTPGEAWTQLQDKVYNNDPAYHGSQQPPSTCTSPPGCHRTDWNLRYWATDFTWSFHQ